MDDDSTMEAEGADSSSTTSSSSSSDDEPIMEPRHFRARNARLIMSNTIPLMVAEEQPYCIWYPDLATEDTYRELARRYPEMRYHVGRACAVGGYLALYRELDLLPDVSIAEEARDNAGSSEGARAIFESIVTQPVRYAVMDDYTRSVNLSTPRFPAYLNGDTAVRSSLLGGSPWRGHYFNITEDDRRDHAAWGSEETDSPPLALEHVPLLYNPLPPDLPTTNKDALILMAAYEGNIDRYARLRRPIMVPDEEAAVIRGIYHHTSFARWCASQPGSAFKHCPVETAVTARFIMVNDLSHITEDSPNARSMPFLIWYPLLPAEATLRALVRRRPETALQVAMACIAADYRALWQELAPEPHAVLLDQARQCGAGEDAGGWRRRDRNFYTDDLERRGEENGVDLESGAGQTWGSYKSSCARRDKEPTSAWVPPEIQAGPRALDDQRCGGVFPDGVQANAAAWELYIAVTDDVRRRAARAAEEGQWIRSWEEEEE